MLLLLAVILKGQSRILLFCFAFLSAWCLSLPKFLAISSSVKGFSGGLSGKETDWQGRSQRKHRFDPWVSKIPWRRKWQPTPIFLPWVIPWTLGARWAMVHGIAQSWTQLKSWAQHTHTSSINMRLWSESGHKNQANLTDFLKLRQSSAAVSAQITLFPEDHMDSGCGKSDCLGWMTSLKSHEITFQVPECVYN